LIQRFLGIDTKEVNIVDESQDKRVREAAEAAKKPIKPTKTFQRANATIHPTRDRFSESETTSRNTSMDSRQSWKPKLQ